MKRKWVVQVRRDAGEVSLTTTYTQYVDDASHAIAASEYEHRTVHGTIGDVTFVELQE